MSFIDVRGVSKAFRASAGVRLVLRDVSFSMERGEFVSVLGAMGTGKSTLLSILAGLTAPDEGTVTMDREPVRGMRGNSAFVFQNYSLLPWFTALENVRLAVGTAFPELTKNEQRVRAHDALTHVGLSAAVQRRPSQLSGGMRQRVAIARAMATQPEVLFLDEPFGALDALTRDTLQQDLMRLCFSGDRPVTVVMITNSVEEALLLSDRIVPIVAGPPATLGPSIPVDLPRPRTAAQLARDDHASRVWAYVVATLTSALGRPRRHQVEQGADATAGQTVVSGFSRAGLATPERP